MTTPSAPIRTSVPLGHVAAHLPMIEVRCHRCARYGRVSTARLLAEHGPDAGMPTVLSSLAGECPQREAYAIQHRCNIYSPDLVRLPQADGQRKD